MDFDDVSLFFTDFAETVSIDGSDVQALIDVDIASALGFVAGQATYIKVPEGTAVNRGSTVIARGITFKVTRSPVIVHGVMTLEVTQQ